jgi:SPP1 family predicted phage head-tail adaptor
VADPCASDLSHLVTVQRPSFADDGAGGSVVTWADYDAIWCAVRLKSGSEPLYRGRKETHADGLFTLRYRSDIREIDRLIHRGKVYAITDTEDIDRKHKWLVLSAGLELWETAVPSVYTPALQFNDARNSQYLAIISAFSG